MAFKQVSGARALLLGIGGFVGIVAAWVGYADLARNFLPADLRVYWPLLMIAGFACALWAVGTVDEKVDGVIYRENIAHRKKIEALEAQLSDAKPRDIPLEQRGRIAQRIADGFPKTYMGKEYKCRWDVAIYALSNAADSPHMARVMDSILQFDFDTNIKPEDGAYSLAFMTEHPDGLTLLFPGEDNRPEYYSHRTECGQLIIDSFAAEGIRVARGQSRYAFAQLTLVIGSRS